MWSLEGLRTWVRGVLLAFPAAAFAALIGYIAAIWNRLPGSLASHFDAAGAPNGWSSKDSFAAGALVVTAVLGTIIYFAARLRIVAGSYAVSVALGILYLVFPFLVSTFWLVLRANAEHLALRPSAALPAAVSSLVCAVLAAWSIR